MKLLSIIIPTYNMEALLPKCLDSLVNAKHVAQLDIIVVNDGSKDHSLSIANDYRERFPNVVTVIDKPNGNYGSTINAALPKVKGKYVRILDSDDFFDTKLLDLFIEKLAHFDVDIVMSHCTQIRPGKPREVLRYNSMGKEVYDYGKEYQLDKVLNDGYIRTFYMPLLTYRSELLISHQYKQTEGISYTDTEWGIYPIFYAQTIVFLDINVYQYNLGREGQTMDPAVIVRSLNQWEQLLDAMLNFYIDYNLDSLSEERRIYLHEFFTHRFRQLYRLYLIEIPREKFDAEELKRIDKKYKEIRERLEINFKLFPENRIIHIDYMRYWNKHHQRWPLWLDRLNHFVDVVVRRLYILIFRR